MKLQKDIILAKLNPYVVIIKRYRILIFILALLGIYTFLIIRIGKITQTEPSSASVDEKQKTVQRLKIDQVSVNKMLQLEDHNVEVKSLFEQARNNPFNE
jgi:hypothetical protein